MNRVDKTDKKQGKLAIIVALLVATLIPVALLADDDPLFDLQSLGYMTGSIYLQPQQDKVLGAVGLRGAYALEGSFLEDFGAKISLDYYANLAGIGDTIATVSTFDLNRFTYQVTGNDRLQFAAEIKEAWIDMAVGEFDIRLGRQIMAWGQADGSNPTDTLNARHIGTRFLSTLDEQKIGTLAANVLYYLPDNAGTIQGVFMPLPSRMDMPSIAMDVTSGSTRMIIEEDATPAFSLANSEVGVRALFYLDQVSVSGSYFTYLDRYPDFSSTFSPPPPIATITLTPTHNRIHQVGFDIVWLVEGWDLRSEWAYFKTTDSDGSDPLVKNSSLSGVVQATRSFWDSALTASFAWAPRYVVNFKELSEYSPSDQTAAAEIRKYDGQAYETESIYTVRLAGKFRNETLQPEIMVLVETAARDWMGRVSVSYNISDGLSTRFGATVYDSLLPLGDADRELGTFSKSTIIDDDYIFAELTYAF